MTSLAPASPPTRIWPSMRGAAVRAPLATTITREGCSRLAPLAASMASSSLASSSATMTRVSTRPSATCPPCSGISTSFLLSCEVVVDGRSMITDASTSGRCARAFRRPRVAPRCPAGTARASPAWPSGPGSGRGSPRTSRPPRSPGTAAVLHLQGHRGVGFGLRVLREAPFVQQAGHLRAALPAARVLPARGGLFEGLERLRRGEDLDLLRPQRPRLERQRLFHRGEGEQLQQVVLDDVARRADAVVVPRAPAEADVLGHGDL